MQGTPDLISRFFVSRLEYNHFPTEGPATAHDCILLLYNAVTGLKCSVCKIQPSRKHLPETPNTLGIGIPNIENPMEPTVINNFNFFYINSNSIYFTSIFY